MTSIAAKLFSGHGKAVSLLYHGETVTHYPLGVVAGAPTPSVIFTPTEPVLDYERGKGTIYRGKLHVEDSLTVNLKDVWLINGAKYKTETISDSEGGMRIVSVIRRDGDSR